MAIALNKTISDKNIADKRTWTDEEFMALSDGDRYELVNGELITVGNSGMEHGNLGAFLCGLLEIYARRTKLGATFDSSTAFTMKTGNKRSPDVSFVVKDRLQGLKKLPKGFFQGAPDLAVEIISPSNTFDEIHSKIVEYFESGSQLVWVIHPDEESILIYHKPQPDKLLQLSDTLDGETVVPGFTLLVADLFADLDFTTGESGSHPNQ
jgi:Uma2 family endonuclease